MGVYSSRMDMDFLFFLQLFSLLLPVLWLCSWPIQISLIFSRVHFKLMSFLSSPFLWLKPLLFAEESSLTFYHIFSLPSKEKSTSRAFIGVFYDFSGVFTFLRERLWIQQHFQLRFPLKLLKLKLEIIFYWSSARFGTVSGWNFALN